MDEEKIYSPLRADSQGFLMGTRRLNEIAKGIDHVDDNIQQILSILKATIESYGDKQVNTIEQLLSQAKIANKQQTKLVEAINKANSGAGQKNIVSNKSTIDAVPVRRDSTPDPQNNQDTSANGPTRPLRPSRPTVEVDAVPRRNNDAEDTAERQRDSKGRFIGANGNTAVEKANTANVLKTAFSKVMEVIATPKDASGYDPSVDAIQELGTILSPAARGFRMVGRGASWLYKRRTKRDEILPEEQAKHNEEVEKHNKEQRKLLKKIADRLAGNGGKGGGLPNIPGGGLLGGLGKKGGKGLGKLLKFGRGMPLIGTALAAMSLMDWDEKSTEEKGGSVGSIAGGVAGGAVGSLLGPVGTVVGGAVGAWAGEKLGNVVAPYVKSWTDSLVKADIPTRISNAWNVFTSGLKTYLSEKLNNTVEYTKEVASTAQDKIESIGDFGASVIDRTLAAAGNKAAQERIRQRERGEIGHQSNVYQAQTTNNAPSPLQTTKNSLDVLTAPNSLSGFIGKGEGDYNSVNLGKRFGYKSGKRNLTTMTVEEVKAMQDRREVNAVGKFQIIRDTMPEVIKGMGLTGKEKFDENMQERMGAYLLFNKRPVLGNYLKGKHDNITAAGDDGAREWASLPVLSNTLKTGKYHSKRGSTAYSDGVNKAGHSAEAYELALRKARATYTTAIKSGMSESEAQLAAFKGLNQVGSPEIKPITVNTKVPLTATTEKTKLVPNAKDKAVQSTASLTKVPLPVAAQAKSIVAESSNSLNKMIATKQPIQKVGAPTPPKVKQPTPKAPKVETVRDTVSNAPAQGPKQSSMDATISQNISDRGLAHTATGGLGFSLFG